MLSVRFGWGKPVQFNPFNLKNPVRDSALIALAGPASNICIAVVISVILKVTGQSLSLFGVVASEVLIVNVVLAIFNLVPVYPLDGSKILLALLPNDLAYEYESFMNRYGMFVLIALIFPWYQGVSPISFLVSPVIQFVTGFLI
jgi:Zn-dependent protease